MMLRAGSFAIVFVFITASVVVADPKDDCAKHQDRSRIIEACTSIIKRGGDVAWAYYNRGRAKTDLDEKIADYSKAIALNPKDPDGLGNRGRAYGLQGNRVKALADLDRAIKLKPDHVHNHRLRGNVYLNTREYDLSIRDYTTAITLDRKDALSFDLRATAYLKAGKYELGLRDAETSLQLTPDNPTFLETRGLLFEKLGRRDEAIADLRRAVSKSPTLADSIAALERLGVKP